MCWCGGEAEGGLGKLSRAGQGHKAIFLLFQFAMEPNYLHIWPRNTFMMIALPNMVITHGHAPLGHGMELVGMNWLWWQGLGGPEMCQVSYSLEGGAGQDPSSQPCLTALSRYLCHFSLCTHLSPPKPPENQLFATGCYKLNMGVPGQRARPMLADHMLPISASPLPAPSVCKPTVGNRVAGCLYTLHRQVAMIAG